MTFQLNFDLLGIFEVINENLASVLSPYANRMAVWAESDSAKWRANINLLHLLSFDYIEKENFGVEPSSA